MNDLVNERHNSPPKAAEVGPKLSDSFGLDTLIGVAVGAGAGVWGALVHNGLEHEETILLTIGTADVALLAVILAAVALMAGFLNGFFGRVIEAASSTWGFFRPFQIVAWVSALGAMLCFAGAIDASHSSRDSRAGIFAAAICLSAWAIVGTVFLVREFINAAVEQRELALKHEKANPAGELSFTDEKTGATVTVLQRPSGKPQGEAPSAEAPKGAGADPKPSPDG